MRIKSAECKWSCPSINNLFIFLFSLSVSWLLVNEALADTRIIDFESLTGSGLVERDAPYAEDGFELSTEWANTGTLPDEKKLASVHDGSDFYSGSVSMIKWFTDDFPILTEQGGESFDLVSIDLDSLYLGNANVEFTGTKAGGETVVQSFLTDSNRNNMETFTFLGFDDLLSVSWVNLEFSTLHHFDNIVVKTNDLNNNVCSVTPIQCGQSIQERLTSDDCDESPRGDDYLADGFTFVGESGATAILAAEWELDGYLYLVDPDGNVVAENDDSSGGNTFSRIEWEIEEEGDYKLWATTYSPGDTGAYEISLACVKEIPDDPNPGFLSVVAGGSGAGDGEPALTSYLSESSVALELDQQGRLIFEDANLIRRVELDGTVSTLLDKFIAPEMTDFAIGGDILFYSWWDSFGGGGIAQLDLNSGQETDISSDGSSQGPITTDGNGNLYFIREFSEADGIYRLELNTGAVDLVVASSDAIEMVIDPADGSLIFTEWDEGSTIQRLNPETGDIHSLLDFDEFIRSFDIHPSGDILFTTENFIHRWSKTTGDTSIVVGNGSPDFSGDGGFARAAGVQPRKIAIADDGGIYFNSAPAANSRQRIRFVDSGSSIISTVVGMPGWLSCASPTDSRLQSLGGIGLDANGIIYVESQNAILAIDTELGNIFTIAGTYGSGGVSEDGAKAFGNPMAPDSGYSDSYFGSSLPDNFAVASNGDIYFSESNRLRRVNRETGLFETIATGGFAALQVVGNTTLYALRQIDNHLDFLKIDFASGSTETVIEGGNEAPVIGESAQGRDFGGLNDIAVDSAGNFYFSIDRSMDPVLHSGIYKIDASSKILTSIVNEGPGRGGFSEGQIRGGLTLDEERGLVYYTNTGRVAIVDNGGLTFAPEIAIVKIDLQNGESTRIAGALFSQFGDISSNPLTTHMVAGNLTVSPTGDLYVISLTEIVSNFPRPLVLKISAEAPLNTTLIPGDIAANSNVGQSISNSTITGSTAKSENWFAAGVPNSRNGAGEVLVYLDSDCRQILRGRLQAPEGTTASQFGSQLAFVGNSLVIGASGESAQTSQSRSSTQVDSPFRLGIFGIKDRHWNLNRDLSDLLPPITSGSDESLVSTHESFAVGSPGANDGEGVVTIFDGAAFENQITVRPTGSSVGRFGKSLAMDGGTLAVGAEASSGGATEVYSKNGSSYTYTGTVQSTRGNTDYAADLAVNEKALYVGAPHSSGGRVFDYDLDDLELHDTLADPVDASNSSFGETLAIEDDVMVVGAPGTQVASAKSSGSSIEASGTESSHASGSVHIFGIKDKRGLRMPAIPLFTLLAFLEEAYGEAVDISNGRIVVGAPETDDGRGTFDPVGEIIDASDLSGLWYDPSLDGEGFNVLVADAGLVVFFYGYDSNGERLWLVSETFSGEFGFGEDIHLSIYKALEGDFASPVPSSEALVKYGLLSMSFGSTRSATFTINGFDGNKISRNTFLADTQANAAAYSGLWYDQTKDGEGYNVISGKPGSVIYYYGSTNDGERLWLVSELLTNNISDGTTVSGKMYDATGGDFYHPAPSATALRDWGTIEARFDDCDSGRFILSGSDGNKTSSVIKLAGVSGAECH